VVQESKDEADVPDFLKSQGGRNARYGMAFYPPAMPGVVWMHVCFSQLPSKTVRDRFQSEIQKEIEKIPAPD
jgi:hypothetical protein